MQKRSTEYVAYLASAAWRERKERALASAAACCWCCRALPTERRLDLHHMTYERLGHEQYGDLVLLCRKCHEAVHARRKQYPTTVAATQAVREFHQRTRRLRFRPYQAPAPAQAREDTRPQVRSYVQPVTGMKAWSQKRYKPLHKTPLPRKG